MIPSAPFNIELFKSWSDESYAGGAFNWKGYFNTIKLEWSYELTWDDGAGYVIDHSFAIENEWAATQRPIVCGNMDLAGLEMNQGEFCIAGHHLPFPLMPKYIDAGLPGAFHAVSFLAGTAEATVFETLPDTSTRTTLWTSDATTNPPDASTAAALDVAASFILGWIHNSEPTSTPDVYPGNSEVVPPVNSWGFTLDNVGFLNALLNWKSGFGTVYRRTNLANTVNLDADTWPIYDFATITRPGTFSRTTAVNETSGGESLVGTIESRLTLSQV